MGVPGAQGQSPVINYVGPEDSAISSWGSSSSSSLSCAPTHPEPWHCLLPSFFQRAWVEAKASNKTPTLTR